MKGNLRIKYFIFVLRTFIVKLCSTVMKVHIIFYFPKESDVKVTDIRYAVNTVMECPTSVYSILKFIKRLIYQSSFKKE